LLLNKNNTTRIKGGNTLTETVPIITSIRPGNSSIPFKLVIDKIIKSVKDISWILHGKERNINTMLRE
jgi:hypothetical protein